MPGLVRSTHGQPLYTGHATWHRVTIVICWLIKSLEISCTAVLISDKTSCCAISRSLEAARLVFKHVGSTAADVPVKFQSDTVISTTSLAASRLTIRRLIGYWNGTAIFIWDLITWIKRQVPRNNCAINTAWLTSRSITMAMLLSEQKSNCGAMINYKCENYNKKCHKMQGSLHSPNINPINMIGAPLMSPQYLLTCVHYMAGQASRDWRSSVWRRRCQRLH